MRARSGSLCTATGRWRSLACAVTATIAGLLFLGSAAWAQSEETSEPAAALRLIKIVPINGTAASPNTKMYSFDISWVDPTTGLYFLADRSNAAVDVIDTKTDTLFGQIGGSAFNFGGDTGVNMPSNVAQGPNGVTVSPNPNVPCIFVTDGHSRVVSINYKVSFVQPASTFNTGGARRADELAFDPKDNLLLVINNADTPAFATLINVSSSCVMNQPKTIFFTADNGALGAEQPVWDPGTQRFYVSIPQIGSNPANGGVIKINPNGGAIEAVYPINFVSPAGLTLNPNTGDLLVGSNTVFDTSGKACTNVVPAPQGVNTTAPPAPLTCTGGIAAPQAAICNPRPGRDCTGDALVAVPGIGGGDEIWFNSGDGNYYVTGSNNAVGPTFGVIAAVSGTKTNVLTQLVPTLPPVPANGTAGTATYVHGSGTAHSIAACSQTPNGPCSINKVYLALPANTDYSDSFGNTCTQGCVAVFSAQ